MYRIVVDTNVIIAALRSQYGLSYKLLGLIDSKQFTIHISVPLMIEYEDVAKRLFGIIPLTVQEIEDILDYICLVASRQQIFYLWRPFLSDPNDDMVLELAVAAQCHFIITFNLRDFRGSEQFGIRAIRPREFLHLIGECP